MRKAIDRLIVAIGIELDEPEDDELIIDADGSEIDPVEELYNILCGDSSYIAPEDLEWPIESAEAFRNAILKLRRKQVTE